MEKYCIHRLQDSIVVDLFFFLKVTQWCLTLGPGGLRPARPLCPWNSGVGSCSLPQGIFPTQGSNTGLLHCRWILLPAEPPGKPRYTEADSLSLLQRNFLTQELNWSLLHCRQILYQLSYQGSPRKPACKGLSPAHS